MAGGHTWQRAMHGRGMCGRESMHGWGVHGREVCMAEGRAWPGVHGRGTYMAGGSMYGSGACMAGWACKARGACVAGGCVWQVGVCMAGGHIWWGCAWWGGHVWQGKTAIAAGGRHPTGMHSCTENNHESVYSVSEKFLSNAPQYLFRILVYLRLV